MRLLGVTLKLYRIYNGTGQEIITIDFTKSHSSHYSYTGA